MSVGDQGLFTSNLCTDGKSQMPASLSEIKMERQNASRWRTVRVNCTGAGHQCDYFLLVCRTNGDLWEGTKRNPEAHRCSYDWFNSDHCAVQCVVTGNGCASFRERIQHRRF